RPRGRHVRCTRGRRGWERTPPTSGSATDRSGAMQRENVAMSMKGLRTALMGIGLAFSIAACDGGHSKVGVPGDPRVQRNALAAAVPVPSERAVEFDDCLGACEAAPEASVQSCCEEVTGSAQCFVE